MDSSAKNQNPVWDYAVRTLQADGHGQDVKRLALRVHREALRQYLALRLGDQAAARTALAEIAVELEQWDTARLTAPPGPRAHLFALARKKLARSGTLLAPQATGPVPLLQNGEQAGKALSKLAPEHAEILELRHARELTPLEIAHVLSESPDEVKKRLAIAESASASAFELGSSKTVAAMAARTFAVQPDSQAAPENDASAQPLHVGTVIGERYTLEKAVGIGAFGQVYRASDNFVPGHTVALKLLHQPAADEGQRQTALRELRLIASVFHPSIVSFKDHGWHHDRLWFVMPWYDGEALEDRMLRKPLSRQEAVSIFVPLANALASMHAVGVRHQDIKPENIFLAQLKTDPLGEDQLQPVLLDLGVAASDAESLIAGTPAYFAPEVAAHYVGEQGAPPVSDKADVFSLALALRNALEPDTMLEVQGTALMLFIAARAEEPPEGPEGAELSFLRPHFARWLSRNPDERPAAAEFAAELSVLLLPEQRAQRRRAFFSWFVPVTAAFLLVLAGGGFAWSQYAREQERLQHIAQIEKQNAELAAAREIKLRKDLELSHGELQSEQEKTAAKRDELAAALQDTEQQAKELSYRTRTLARERASTAKELEQTAAELESLNARADELNSTKEQLEASLQAARQRLVELLTQSNELSRELDQTRDRLASEQDNSQRLAAQLATTKQESDAQRERAERLRDERNDAQKQAEMLQNKLDKRSKELQAAQDEVDAEQAQIKKLKEQLKKAKAAAPAKGAPAP